MLDASKRSAVFLLFSDIDTKKADRLVGSVAGAEGLEPSTKVLETHVLPLHHAPKTWGIIAVLIKSVKEKIPFICQAKTLDICVCCGIMPVS